MTIKNKFTLVVALALGALMATTGVALADVPDPTETTKFVFPEAMFWTFVAANLAPAFAYALNYLLPHRDERLKGAVFFLTSAVAGGVAQAITVGNVGFNMETAQLVVFAIATAFASHKFAWQPTELAHTFGAGRNLADEKAAA